MIRFVTAILYSFSLLAIALGQTNEKPAADSPQTHGPDGQRIRKYVKEWTIHDLARRDSDKEQVYE